MTGRPATYATEDIIRAIETLREDPARDVNVNQIRALLNGGNRDRIRRVLDAYQQEKASEDARAEASAGAAGFPKLEESLRAEVGETLVANLNSVVSLIGKVIGSEEEKARRELVSAKEAYELLLRERDADVARAKRRHAELCALLDDVNSELDAAYASAADLTAQRDAKAQERDRLASEADRLAAENARLSAELNKRKSRVRKPPATAKVVAAEKTGTANAAQPKTGPDCVGVERPAARGASDVAVNVLQSTMFSLSAEPPVHGDGSEPARAKSMEGPGSGQSASGVAHASAPDAHGSKPSKLARAGAPSLWAVGAVSPGPAPVRAMDGTGG